MNAPSNVADADHVLRLVRVPGLGSVCPTLCAHCLGRVVGSGTCDSFAHAYDCVDALATSKNFARCIAGVPQFHDSSGWNRVGAV